MPKGVSRVLRLSFCISDLFSNPAVSRTRPLDTAESGRKHRIQLAHCVIKEPGAPSEKTYKHATETL